MKLLKREDGAALVEFALVISLLFLIIFGIIEFGRIFNAQITVTQAAREGARLGVVTLGDVETVKNKVKERAASVAASIGVEKSDVDVVIEAGSVKVTVPHEVDLIAPMIATILGDDNGSKPGDQFLVQGKATMRVE